MKLHFGFTRAASIARERCAFPLALGFVFALALTAALPACAHWNAAAEPIHGHPTWIYTPASTIAGGHHALLIVLHGCVQSNDELKAFGKLEAPAEANATVIALPGVGERIWQGSQGGKCWDYDGARDDQGNMADIAALANTLKGRASLDIDPNYVYVGGLSAGGALALALGCKAPDVFAGVAAIAGPSVGSSQELALNDELLIPINNVEQAVERCKALAGPRLPSLASQLAHIAFGDMDLNGGAQRYPYFVMSSQERLAHAGQLSLISAQWSRDNASALQRLYGAGALGAPQNVQGAQAAAQYAARQGRARVALMVVHGVGHAWPAGAGAPGADAQSTDARLTDAQPAEAQPAEAQPAEAQPADAQPADAPQGLWIAQRGLAYPDTLLRWFIANNLRSQLAPQALLSASASVADPSAIGVSGLARAPGGAALRIDTALLDAASKRELARHDNVAIGADGSYADSFRATGDGSYVVAVRTAGRNAATVLSNEVQVGAAQAAPRPCYRDTNVNHVIKGRAKLCEFGLACAIGSGDSLGWFNPFISSAVVEDAPGYFRRGLCAGP
jgi:poly(3-hydroxybutyrate) depolymerase